MTYKIKIYRENKDVTKSYIHKPLRCMEFYKEIYGLKIIIEKFKYVLKYMKGGEN